MDMGASYHAILQKIFFSSYKFRDFSLVKMENGDTSKIMGIYYIYIDSNVSYKLVLKGV